MKSSEKSAARRVQSSDQCSNNFHPDTFPIQSVYLSTEKRLKRVVIFFSFELSVISSELKKRAGSSSEYANRRVFLRRSIHLFQLAASEIVTENALVVPALFGQALSTGLTHANPVTKAGTEKFGTDNVAGGIALPV